MVGAPTASRHLIALSDDPAFGGNAIVPLHKVERFKRGRRRVYHAIGDILTDWNRLAWNVCNPLVNFTVLRTLLTDHFEPAGASSVLVDDDGGGLIYPYTRGGRSAYRLIAQC